jgi:hypothetical protein
MTAQESFDALIRAHVAPALKMRGFRRTRSTFHRAVGANWEVVNVQRSQFSDAQHIKLTVNLAVGLDRLRGGGRDWADGKRPPDYKCHLRVRLGQLLTDEDVWWDLRPDTDLDVLGETLREAIERYGLLWLHARSDDELLRDTYLADLPAVPSWELRPLHQLVQQLGPPEAVTVVAAEICRRGCQDAQRPQNASDVEG